MKNLVVYKTSSLGMAYRVAQIHLEQGFKLLELFPIGGCGHLLLEHSKKVNTSDLVQNLEGEVLKRQIINDCPLDVFKTYMSVENSPLNKNLLVIETDFIGTNFELAKELVSHNLSLVDLRLLRGVSNHTYLIATGAQLSDLNRWAQRHQKEGVFIQILEDLHPDFSLIF